MFDENVVERLRAQRDGIEEWLENEAPYTQLDQKHLDADTPERAYWHLGYQVALEDIIRLIEAASPAHTPGKSN